MTRRRVSPDIRTNLQKAMERLIAQWRLNTQEMRSNSKRYPEGRILAIEACADELARVLAEAEWPA
jgi:hypothetical protein